MLRGLSRSFVIGSSSLLLSRVQIARCAGAARGYTLHHNDKAHLNKNNNGEYDNKDNNKRIRYNDMDEQREQTSCAREHMGEENEKQSVKREEEEAPPPRPPPLPKLSKADFKTYNHMADTMDLFHNHFRHTWNTLHTACTNNKRPAGMSIRQFLNAGLEFCHQLTMHHTIEERRIFPILARRMDIFKESAELLTQHEGIHEGLVVFEEYLDEVKGGGKELDLRELKGVMDGFGGTLWSHLDAEVEALGAENMRRYWSLEEMRRMPM